MQSSAARPLSAFPSDDTAQQDTPSQPLPERKSGADREFKPGRPRSEESRRAILDSTRRLLTHMPVSKISIESIAKKAGVGKTTIYRWWPHKQAVLIEAVFSQPGFQNFAAQSVSPAEGIKAQIERMCRQCAGKNGRIVAEIVGECQGDIETLKALVKSFFQDRYNALAYYLQRGKAEGAFRNSIDLEVAIDLVLGPVIFRLMSGQNLDDAFAGKLSEMVNAALSA